MKTSKLSVFKFLSLSVTVFLLSSTTLHSSSIPSAGQGFEESYEYSMSIVEQSKALRKSVRQDRSIAGMTSEDLMWQKEFDRIMKDNETDFLEVASQMRH